MTARQVFEAMLSELNNTNSPSLLLDDYNYFINKVVLMYINKRYGVYDITQQTSDDLRVLKSSAILSVKKFDLDSIDGDPELIELLKESKIEDATYEVTLPSDYLHILNCSCIYKVTKRSGCYNEGNVAKYPAIKLTADSWSVICNDYYNRPTPKRPYYYIHNVNTSTELPTNKLEKTDGTLGKGTDLYLGDDTINFAEFINTNNKEASTIEKEAGVRYGNASSVRLEIRYGQADIFKLKGVKIDYIKAPQYIRLTQEQMSKTEDTSLILEFPDYVCQEIINLLVTVVMANNADPRLQTVPIVSQSVVDPQKQTTTTAKS